MSSFRRMGLQTQVGSAVSPTIDCFTRPGAVQMVNELAGTLESDMARIREMEMNRELFILK